MKNVAFDAVKDLCTELGADITLVQGAGGNVSYKKENDFWIKASGTWLADANRSSIFVHLDLNKVLAGVEAGTNDFSSCILENIGLRPSIETSLHAILPQAVVVHVHSIHSLSWVVRTKGKDQVAERLEGLNWAWVDYVRPGLPLTSVIQSIMKEKPKTNILLLANHGVFVAAETASDASHLLIEVEDRLLPPVLPTKKLDQTKIDKLAKLLPAGSRLPVNPMVNLLGQDPRFMELAITGSLYPDNVVFIGPSFTAVAPSDLLSLETALSSIPFCAIVEGLGVVLGANCSESVEAQLECLVLLCPTLPDITELKYLSDNQVAELLNWDEEKLRQALDKSRQAAKKRS
jgi:rhamnose utilization protein RhaD (predicted bifunctional aldolase and dehydrogenase)